MQFSETMASVQVSGGEATGQITDDWLQGRSAFGGLQAALALKAMRALLPVGLPLRVLQVTFIAPVPSGTVRIASRVLRQGKSVVQVESRLLDGDDTACLVIGVFGAARASKVSVLPSKPELPVTGTPRTMPWIPGVVPAFTQHFEARWLQGELPFTGGTSTTQVIDVSLKDAGPTTEEHVVALADFIPPIALALLDTPTPGSSLTWMLELFADSRELPLQHWRIDAQLQAGLGGYTSQQVMLWGPGGEPVALSRQSMVVFG